MSLFHHSFHSFILHKSINRESGVLAVGKASDDATKVSVLILDAYLDIRDLMVVIYLGSLSGEGIADLGTVEKHDVVLDAESESLTAVHDGGNGDVV